MESNALRVGIMAYPSPKWIAGVSYIRNTLRAIAFAGEDVKLFLFLIEPEHSLLKDPALSDLNFEVLPHIDQRSGWRKYQTYLELTAQFKKFRLDVVHNFVLPLPRPIQVPFVFWLPDFQYIHMPHFFTSEEIKKRSRYEMRCVRFSKNTILSSHEALKDYERIFPQYAHKARVIHFPALITSKDILSEGSVYEKYGITSPFFAVCNQFWKHKNHALVFEAIKLLKQNIGKKFQVVFTGPVHDFRNPMYFNELLQHLNGLGIRDVCNILGQIKRSEMLEILRKALCVIQPSFFEGWNTVVEECRTLNVPVLLSDIAVHREQMQEEGLTSSIFDPSSAEDLSQLMNGVLEGKLFSSLSKNKGKLNSEFVIRKAKSYANELIRVWREAKKN